MVYGDLIIMITSISRQELFNVLQLHFPELLPLAHLLYDQANQVTYRWEDNTWHTIDIVEGLSQGCLLSGVFSSLVINRVLRSMDNLLKQQDQDRLLKGNTDDDNHGLVTNIWLGRQSHLFSPASGPRILP